MSKKKEVVGAHWLHLMMFDQSDRLVALVSPRTLSLSLSHPAIRRKELSENKIYFLKKSIKKKHFKKKDFDGKKNIYI